MTPAHSSQHPQFPLDAVPKAVILAQPESLYWHFAFDLDTPCKIKSRNLGWCPQRGVTPGIRGFHGDWDKGKI
jgi:hypothetical protein